MTHVPGARFGVELAPEHPVDRVVDLGVAAEAAGFEDVYLSVHYNNRDPFAALARLAERTDRVGIGPGVANPHDRHPLTLASQVATLDEASGGRARFGIGPGDPTTMQSLDAADDRGLRPVLETFKTLERLWAGERVDHDGAFTAVDAGLNYEPPQGASIPVHVGGEGPQMCRMAAKHADGLLFNGSHPDDLAWARTQVEDGLGERPDGRGPFALAAYASVSVADDDAAAREAARPPVAYITAGMAPPVLDRHGIDPDRADEIGDRLSVGAYSEAFDLVTSAMVDAFCMAGDVETVADRMDRVLDHADGIIVGSPLGPDVDTALDLASEAYSRAT
ncbi:MAG: flavin-dependent oxidoreductase [uncultured archaeon A07HB70]|nr:MAG: flavin-dependent oxidoreductase [uncultured archaeon A07HB70]